MLGILDGLARTCHAKKPEIERDKIKNILDQL